MQQKQQEWAWQWEKFSDDNLWLFTEWIWPNTLEDFRAKDVLDCGCGGGQHLSFLAPYCKRLVGVDLNALSCARERTQQYANIELLEEDIASMVLKQDFDIVYSIGVLHHTDNPTVSFQNIARHCKVGGRVIVWVYAHEGNTLNRLFLEPFKSIVVRHLPRSVVRLLAHCLTLSLYPPIYSIYLLIPQSAGKRVLPFYEYFENWRKLPYQRNLLNVFDKLNAPQTWFISESQVRSWFAPEEFTDVHISAYKGVSWRASGTKK